jgi:hypothetical protein
MASPDDTDPAGTAPPGAAASEAPGATASEAPGAQPSADAPALPEDQTFKHLLDAATRAELERWFGLPSFQELADRGEPPPAEDPEMAAVQKRRQEAIAAVDPAMLEAHRKRVEASDTLIQFEQKIDVQIDPAAMARIDLERAERGYAVTEPREVEIAEEMRDDLAECTPQAVLRDLHRPELYFDKTFEVVDMAAEQKLDIVALVAESMATSWALPPLSKPVAEARALIAELRADRLRDTAQIIANLPNRRVTEP